MRATLAVPALLLAVLLAAGCSVGGGATDRSAGSPADSGAAGSASSDDSATEPGGADPRPRQLAQDGGGTSPARKVGSTPALTRAIISTGEIFVRARSLSDARLEVTRLVSRWDGAIADEQTSGDGRGRLQSSTLTLRVPVTRFDEAMGSLGRLGRVEQQRRTSEDVTTQVIDTDARVRAAERSIRQIEALLGRARRLSDIIAIEADLARRQADLDSLKSQQSWLEDQTSLSTIVVHLSRTGTDRPDEDPEGFLAGLDAGWTALKGSTVALLTVLGAMLPFAAMVALLGVPVWVLARRRLSAGSAPARSS